MVVRNLQVSFLREKIEDIRSALLFSESKSVLKLPNCIVSTLQVDEMGYIWLLAPRPRQAIKEFEQKFPVQLNFYQKGKDFYLNVTGSAGIVLEPSETDEMLESCGIQKNILKRWILIKVEIADAQYHVTAPIVKNNLLSYLSAQVNRWLFPAVANYRTLNV